MSPKNILFWSTALIGVVLDQATKIWVVNNIEYRAGEIDIIPGLLSLVHAQNPGAAFGMLDSFEYRHYVFAVFTVIAVGVILDMVRRLHDSDRMLAVAMGLIASGAVGNAIDRVHKRTVTDFVRIYTDDPEWSAWLVSKVGMAEWPAFNVADAALLIGVALFFLHAMFHGEDDALAPAPGEASPGEP